MKKYYVVMSSNCQKRTDCLEPTDKVEITIADSDKGYRVLWEIEANSYSDALKMVTFSKRSCGNYESL